MNGWAALASMVQVRQGVGKGRGQRSQQDLLMEWREEERQDLGLSPRTWCGMQNDSPKDNPYYLQTGEYAIFHGKRDLQVQLKA